MNAKRRQQQDRRQAVILAYTALKYSELHAIATDGSRSAQERTKALYKAVRGHARITSGGRHTIQIDGTVNGYTLYNLIDTDTGHGLIRLAEDLTTAYYRTAGGKGRNTYSLINAILGPASPYKNI